MKLPAIYKSFQELRIVFMGTPEFAVASLTALLQAGATIVGVITAPDKPAGRGMKLGESPVKKMAVEKNLPLLQPEKLKDPSFLNALEQWKADVQVVVAFRMLPEVVWNMPPLGTLNLHGSLLPDYRGAAPINWAVINGETTTGVTTFRLQHDIDTGHVLLQEAISIGPNETAGEVHDRMKEIGARLVVKTLQEWVAGRLQETPQEELLSRHPHPYVLKSAPKLFPEIGRIDCTKSAREVHNLIRGLSPHPGAFLLLGQKKLKLFKSECLSISSSSKQPGEVWSDARSGLFVQCGDGPLSILEVQLEGKKKMPVKEFLLGYRFTPET